MKKKKVYSKKFSMTQEELSKWFRNVLLFSSPALLVFLTALAAGRPIQEAAYALYVALLNALIDFLRKWIPENTFK